MARLRSTAMTAGPVAGADLGQVLGEHNVADPVQAVLDMPVPADDLGEAVGGDVVEPEAGDGVDRLGGPFLRVGGGASAADDPVDQPSERDQAELAGRRVRHHEAVVERRRWRPPQPLATGAEARAPVARARAWQERGADPGSAGGPRSGGVAAR